MSCRSANGLSQIVSCIGVPICMDHYTSIGERAVFAFVLMEDVANDPLLHSINIRCKGSSFEQSVVHRWNPASCINCETFSHDAQPCSLKQQHATNQKQAEKVRFQKRNKKKDQHVLESSKIMTL